MSVEKRTNTPTRSNLAAEFRFISRSSYRGVRGVWHLSSGQDGPAVGIGIHTHGNEPAGLAALWYARHVFNLKERLRCGRVFFVLNNILAAERYLKAKMTLEKLEARFVDANMNRLPSDLEKLDKDSRYEIRRARKLLPVWSEFTAALDIHSTAKQGPPMIIQVGEREETERLTRNFPIRTIIADITEYQLRKPAIAFYGDPQKPIPSVGIEAGSHESKRAFAVAIECVRQFLAATGVIEGERTRKRVLRRRTYFVGGSVIFPDRSWQLTKVFRMFERIRKGRILAVDSSGHAIRAPFTGVTLFGQPRRRRPVKLGDEVLFLARTRLG